MKWQQKTLIRCKLQYFICLRKFQLFSFIILIRNFPYNYNLRYQKKVYMLQKPYSALDQASQAQLLLENQLQVSTQSLASNLIRWVSYHSWEYPKLFDISLHNPQTRLMTAVRRALQIKEYENQETIQQCFFSSSPKRMSIAQQKYVSLPLQSKNQTLEQYYKLSNSLTGVSENCLNRLGERSILAKTTACRDISCLLYFPSQRWLEMQLMLNLCQKYFFNIGSQGLQYNLLVEANRSSKIKIEDDCALATQFFPVKNQMRLKNFFAKLNRNKQPEMLVLTFNAYLQTYEQELPLCLLGSKKSTDYNFSCQQYNQCYIKNRNNVENSKSEPYKDQIPQRDQPLNTPSLKSLNKAFQQFLPNQLQQPSQSHQNQYNQTLNGVQYQRVNHAKCLGCSRYFDSNKTIYQRNASVIPLQTFPSILRLKNYEIQFKDAICSMLNSGGGIILFSCETVQQNIYARGEYLTEKHKQFIQQRIISYFRWILPKPEINSNITITFVPILAYYSRRDEREETNKFWYNQKPEQRNFIEGRYVTRLRVTPTDSISVYSWFYTAKQQKGQNSKQRITSLFCSILDQQNGPKSLKFGGMRRLIKKKFKQNYIPPHLDDLSSLLLQQPINIFGHQCGQPQQGHPIMKQAGKAELKSGLPEFQKINQHTLANTSQRYPNMTLLIIKQDDLLRIKQKLIQAAIQCLFQIRFSKYKFKQARNSAILYHKVPFEIVHSLIVNDSHSRFSNGKPYIALDVSEYLRFQFRNQKNTLDSGAMAKYKNQLSKQFQYQSVSFYRYQQGPKKVEYYLSTGSKLSLLFMYFSLNHLGQKVSLKNPFKSQIYLLSDKIGRFKSISAGTEPASTYNVPQNKDRLTS